MDTQIRRYNLALPAVEYEAVEKAAAGESATVLSIIRRSLKIGLMIYRLSHQPNTKVYIEQDGVAKEVLFL